MHSISHNKTLLKFYALVLGLALLIYGGTGDLTRALTALLAFSPYAFVHAKPMAVSAAAGWLAAHGIALRLLLVRTRETAPLYEHTRTERQRELRGAFALAADADATGRDILLVDDIMTSGATLTECARTLKRAGARRVYAFVLASEHL